MYVLNHLFWKPRNICFANCWYSSLARTLPSRPYYSKPRNTRTIAYSPFHDPSARPQTRNIENNSLSCAGKHPSIGKELWRNIEDQSCRRHLGNHWRNHWWRNHWRWNYGGAVRTGGWGGESFGMQLGDIWRIGGWEGILEGSIGQISEKCNTSQL